VSETHESFDRNWLLAVELDDARDERFWRLVRFEGEHEPEWLDYYAELERAEEYRKSQERKRRAVLMPPPAPGRLMLEQALDRLEGVRPSGPSRWSARCPVHEDTNASLVVSENEARPGEAVAHCFAGCDWRAVKDALRR
jgi:hypothetical protein